MLNESSIANYISDANAFTIELTEEIYTELGWTQKGHCLRTLTNELIEGVDFISKSGEWRQGGRSSDLYSTLR